jgi:hypothetical protein
MAEIPDVRSDARYIAVVLGLEAIEAERLEVLKDRYGIIGFNSLGGHIRPALRLCNMESGTMFDGEKAKLGDVVAIGTLYTKDATTVLVCRLSEDHAVRPYALWPACERTGYRFRWSVEAIAEHAFEPAGR